MSQLAIIQTKDLLSPSDIEVLKQSKFKNFTDAEINYAKQVSSHLQLNPLINQIHFVKRLDREGKATIAIQVGIDGFRLAAERTGKYAGSDEPTFEYGTDITKPIKASVTVYKLIDGVRCPFTGSARWDEYFPGDKQGTMWRKMPHNQLAKCAESLALRKAFPAELSALRTDEEMLQADKEQAKSKAALLNDRGQKKAEPPIVDAEFSEMSSLAVESETEAEPVPESVQDSASVSVPTCCGKQMLISKWPDKETGKIPYWCTNCKRKIF